MQHDSGMEQAARLLGEKLVPHDQHRVRRRAPRLLRRVTADAHASRHTRNASLMAHQHA